MDGLASLTTALGGQVPLGRAGFTPVVSLVKRDFVHDDRLWVDIGHRYFSLEPCRCLLLMPLLLVFLFLLFLLGWWRLKLRVADVVVRYLEVSGWHGGQAVPIRFLLLRVILALSSLLSLALRRQQLVNLPIKIELFLLLLQQVLINILNLVSLLQNAIIQLQNLQFQLLYLILILVFPLRRILQLLRILLNLLIKFPDRLF